MELSTIILFVSYMLEIFILLKLFDKKLQKRYSSYVPYTLFVIGDLLISFISSCFDAQYKTIFFIISLFYTIAIVQVLYLEKTSIKLFMVGLFYIYSLIGDFVTIGILLLVGFTSDDMSNNKMVNSFASLISKMVLLTLVLIFHYIVKIKIHSDYIFIVLSIFSTITCETPCIMLFQKIHFLENNYFLLYLFVFGQIALLTVNIYISVKLSKKLAIERELKERNQVVEIELKSSKEIENILEQQRKLKHDLKSHMGLIQEYLKDNDISNALKHIEEISQRTEQITEFYALNSKKISTVINQRKSQAVNRNIDFIAHIITSDFIMDENDVCTILFNILDNAIEATNEEGCIILTIDNYDDKGQQIRCINTYITEPSIEHGRYKTLKEDKENHGKGIEIVQDVVKKYNGNSRFQHNEKNKTFTVEIFIPRKEH